MRKEFNVDIRFAFNGFIVRYEEEETLACEFVAVSLEEVLEIVKDLFTQKVGSGFSDILVNDLKE